MGCKPFYITTEHFGVTYHGKKTPSGHYRNKTGKKNQMDDTRLITNQSQKNLCILIDSIPEFVCRYRLLLSLDKPEFTADTKKSKMILTLFIRYLSKEDFNEGDKPPLFFWKKKIKDNAIIFELLTNAQFSFNPSKLQSVIQYLWFKYSLSYNATITKIAKSDELDIIRDFALNFEMDLPAGTDKNGKWWGAINRKYYTVKHPEKRYLTLKEIIEIESESKQNIANNLFIIN